MKKLSLKSPIFLAILCAVGVHTVLFTNAGHRLQSAIVESDITSHAEAHLVADVDKISFKVNVTATNVTKIEGTLNYDNKSLELTNLHPTIGEMTTSDGDFAKKITLTFATPINIRKGDTLITWNMKPLAQEVHSVNLTDVIIRMTDGDKSLTTEGTGEF